MSAFGIASGRTFAFRQLPPPKQIKQRWMVLFQKAVYLRTVNSIRKCNFWIVNLGVAKTQMKKILSYLLIIVIVATLFYRFCYPYKKDRAATYVATHCLSRSHHCCAWFVMKGIIAGGEPCIILPAWAYEYYLPFIGFEEVSETNYKHEVGDIVVFPAVKGHKCGHIAMWDGTQWVSDFKQKNFIVAPEYRGSKYKFYRHK